MRLHNFFIAEKIGDKKEIIIADRELLHQWLHVFRFGKGSEVVLLDNSGDEFDARFVLLTKTFAEFRIALRRRSANLPKKEVWLFQSLVKKDTFELIAKMATELGVSHITPLLSERSEKKDVNLERLKKIVTEASEQSERGLLPALHEVVTLPQALSIISFRAVAFQPDGQAFIRESCAGEPKLAIFIGPEGGWGGREISLFEERNIPTRSLGRQILRSETAALAALSLLLL